MPRAEGQHGQQVHRQRQGKKGNHCLGVSYRPGHGALSARPVQTVRTGLGPQMISIAPDGKSAGKNAYVTSEGKGALSQFAISPVTGKITPCSAAAAGRPGQRRRA
jgi:hypothetical protein